MKPTDGYWAHRYIGRPWIAGARGPESFDCWGLFLWVQGKHFGRELPLIPVDALSLRVVLKTFNDHPERKRWQRVSAVSLMVVACCIARKAWVWCFRTCGR
jgi:hypothetical protein